MSNNFFESNDSVPMSNDSIWDTSNLLANIVEMACEHESDLKLIRLINFMDLYRAYLSQARTPDSEITECVSFERFIGDTRLLQLAAAVASHECGFAVATPLPLKLSANSNSVSTEFTPCKPTRFSKVARKLRPVAAC